jgi:hypothetical protein
MLYLKVMSDEKLSNDNSLKNFRVYTIRPDQELRFELNGKYGEPGETRFVAEISTIPPGSPHESRQLELVIALTGTAYLLNEAGRTIASHDAY